ncbi:MAG: hypothetical protein Ta2E_11760 [Mycoplasmoidaceae bacterium]|nr:MAG: hypothetical protein Ta2E_11760 [Mycoplasmoidaceae bacterium]
MHFEQIWKKNFVIQFEKTKEKIKRILQSLVEHLKLEKTEVSGIHGHTLSTRFDQLQQEFDDVSAKLASIENDLFTVTDSEFKTEIESIEALIQHLDVTAVSIAIWATDDCNSTVSFWQILSGLGSLIFRKFLMMNFNANIQILFNNIRKLLMSLVLHIEPKKIFRLRSLVFHHQHQHFFCQVDYQLVFLKQKKRFAQQFHKFSKYQKCLLHWKIQQKNSRYKLIIPQKKKLLNGQNQFQLIIKNFWTNLFW